MGKERVSLLPSCGEVPERLNGSDSKSEVGVSPTVGSNPTLSASYFDCIGIQCSSHNRFTAWSVADFHSGYIRPKLWGVSSRSDALDNTQNFFTMVQKKYHDALNDLTAIPSSRAD